MIDEIPSHASQNEKKKGHIYKKSLKKSKIETVRDDKVPVNRKELSMKSDFSPPKFNTIPKRWRAKPIVRHDVRRNINIDDVPHCSMIPLCKRKNKYYFTAHIHWVITAKYSFIYFEHVVLSIVQKTQIMDTVCDQFWSKCENNIIWIV